MWFYDIIALVFQLIWYYSISWVSNIGDLLLVLIFDSEFLRI